MISFFFNDGHVHRVLVFHIVSPTFQPIPFYVVHVVQNIQDILLSPVDASNLRSSREDRLHVQRQHLRVNWALFLLNLRFNCRRKLKSDSLTLSWLPMLFLK